MLDLSNVTLVTIDSAADHLSKNNIRLATISRIVPKLCEQIKFGDVLTINPFNKNKHLIEESFEPLWDYDFEKNTRNINWYSNFVIKKLPHLINTDWYLIIQWDGFPINNESWTNDFFEYPFLGGGHSVYNGGFSLRKTKTMVDLSKINNDFGSGAEDGFYSSFLDNEFMSNRNTPVKLKWDEEEIVNKFCVFLKYDQKKPFFGWHRSNHLSEWAIQEMYKHSKCFNNSEIRKILEYCSTKTISEKLFINDYMKHFDMEYNNDFFDNY